MFDLAKVRWAPAGERTWTEGEGWVVMTDVSRTGEELRRRIVTFRRVYCAHSSRRLRRRAAARGLVAYLARKR
jgi:hypothetical protein